MTTETPQQHSAPPLRVPTGAEPGVSRRAVPLSGRLWRLVFGLGPHETTFVHRGFNLEGEPGARARLEAVGGFFVSGYHCGLETAAVDALGRRLAGFPLADRGFVFEGAAMAVALRGLLFPWRWRRLEEYLAGPADPHYYMALVGVGWALAVLPVSHERVLRRLDPLWRWLAMDGFGFQRAYFEPRVTVTAQRVPARVRGYARRAFDQGLGRALWFVEGAHPRRVAAAAAALPAERRADVWAGVGLACAYAGGVEPETLRALRAAAGAHAAELAQGVCFAAKARVRAGNPTAHTECAAQVLCGSSADAVARLTDETGVGLPPGPDGEGYEEWRRRLRRHFAGQGGTR